MTVKTVATLDEWLAYNRISEDDDSRAHATGELAHLIRRRLNTGRHTLVTLHEEDEFDTGGCDREK